MSYQLIKRLIKRKGNNNTLNIIRNKSVTRLPVTDSAILCPNMSESIACRKTKVIKAIITNVIQVGKSCQMKGKKRAKTTTRIMVLPATGLPSISKIAPRINPGIINICIRWNKPSIIIIFPLHVIKDVKSWAMIKRIFNIIRKSFHKSCLNIKIIVHIIKK